MTVAQPTQNPARHLPRDPQLGPLKALVELRMEHPELARVQWGLSVEGHLFGTTDDPLVFASYVQVLGGRPMAPVEFGEPLAGVWTCDQLFAQWRDVEFSLSGQYTTHPSGVAA